MPAHGVTVTVVRPPGKSIKTGDPVAGDPVEVEYPGCVVWPRSGNESGAVELTDHRQTVIDGVYVLFPTGADVEPTDQLVINGARFDVDGRPFDWRSEFTGTEAGVQVAAIRVTG